MDPAQARRNRNENPAVSEDTDITVAVAVAVGTVIAIASAVEVEVHDERDEGIEVMIEVGIVIGDIVIITMMIGNVSVVGVKTGIGTGIGIGITVAIGIGRDPRTIIARDIALVPDHRIDLTADIEIIDAQTEVIPPPNDESMQTEAEIGKVMIVEIEIRTKFLYHQTLLIPVLMRRLGAQRFIKYYMFKTNTIILSNSKCPCATSLVYIPRLALLQHSYLTAHHGTCLRSR